MKFLHKQEEMKPELLKDPEVVQFIVTTSDILDNAADGGLEIAPTPDIVIQRLKESNFIFSGYKTFHEMNEAFPSLVDKDGNRKPFNEFYSDVTRIHKDYNIRYLETEYNFAFMSALGAAQWQKYSEPGEDGILQYRAIHDGRTRLSHKALDRITLPLKSKFWIYYFPPNGWDCRCDVVRVRKGKYPMSNEEEAMKLGEIATSGKHQEMFRFNPGISQAIFPDYNPYTSKSCKGCEYKRTSDPKNDLCAACKVIIELRDKRREEQKNGK